MTAAGWLLLGLLCGLSGAFAFGYAVGKGEARTLWREKRRELLRLFYDADLRDDPRRPW